jgi:hypothetical protein
MAVTRSGRRLPVPNLTLLSLAAAVAAVLSFSGLAAAKRQQIDEIAKRQLDQLITTEDYLAVFWRKTPSNSHFHPESVIGLFTRNVFFVSLCVTRCRATRLERILTVCRVATRGIEQHKNYCSLK